MNAVRLLPFIACAMPLAAACHQDPGAPAAQIEITFPEEGSLQRADRIRVRGTAEATDQLDVNGVVAEVVGGEWEALVPVEQGTVTVTASTDGAVDRVTFTVDSYAPLLNVTAPERAQYRDASGSQTLTVSGTVADTGTGVEIVKIGEQIVPVDDAGNWSWDLTLVPGLNTIAVTARDRAGNEADDIRGVMYGEFVAPDATIDPGFDVWLDQTAMVVMEEVVEGFVTPENMLVMATAFSNESVTISSIDLAPVDTTITLRRGALDLALVATDVVITGAFTLSGTQHDIRVEARRLRIAVTATPVVTPEGLLDVTFSEPMLELLPEDLSYDIADLSDADNEFLEGLVIESARAGFGYVLSRGFFSAIYDEDVLDRKITIFGKELAFKVSFKQIDVYPDGMLVQTLVTMPAEKWPDVRDAPGALNRAPGDGTGYDPQGDVAFTVTQNMLDRLLHGVWSSGLLHYQLDSSTFAGFDLPVELTAGALGAVLDAQLGAIAGDSTPAALRLRPMFPPVAQFDGENSRLAIALGEAFIDVVLLPRGQEPVTVATISAFLDLSVRLSIVEGIVARLDFDTELRADIAEEPLADLDDEATEEFLEQLIALIPQVLAAGLDLRGEADISWVTLSEPRVSLHGAQKDYATVDLQMTANPQTLDPFEPPQTP